MPWLESAPTQAAVAQRMIELIVEVVGEFLIQLVIEVLVEMGLYRMAEGRERNPFFSALGYLLLGAILGALSLLVFPHYLVPPAWRMANLVLTPVAVGYGMVLTGKRRARRGQTVPRIDRFVFGFLFAFSLGLVRYLFAD